MIGKHWKVVVPALCQDRCHLNRIGMEVTDAALQRSIS